MREIQYGLSLTWSDNIAETLSGVSLLALRSKSMKSVSYMQDLSYVKQPFYDPG